MDIPTLPARWDLVLFILGFAAVFFYLSNKWMILFGVFLMGLGIILGAFPHISLLALSKYPTDDEVQDWVAVYFVGTGFLLLFVLVILGVILFS
jgi:hypothetical protein